MGLINDVNLIDNTNAAAKLLFASQALRAQETANDSEINLLKAQIKLEVAQDNFNSANLRGLADKIDMAINIIAQKNRNKTDLAAMRDRLTNLDYKAELLQEENLL